jgi:hypothetical protein
MGYKFNPFTGNLDTVDSPNGVFEEIDVNGDITLDDGGSFTTTLQTVTPTANRTISFPDATGTVGLVAGSSGQLVYNNAGAYAGVSTMTFDGTSVTLAGRLINSYTSLASSPAKVFTGTWFTGGTSTTTKPHFLIEPAGATSTAWSTAGTGFGVNAASGFTGRLLDLQLNGTSRAVVTGAGNVGIGTTGPTAPLTIDSSTSNSSVAIFSAGTALDRGLKVSLFSDGGRDNAGVTLDAQNTAGTSGTLAFATRGTERARIDSSGRLLVGTATNTGGSLFQVNDNRIRIATAKTPASATDTGFAGEICWDADYIYICTATNTWKRAAIATW